MSQDTRPLSPHISIYRPQLNSITSILNRITGVGLTVGAVAITAWLVSAAVGGPCFEHINGILSSWFGMIILIPSLWALWYHFCAGIRHLVWDAGYGFGLKTVEISSYLVIAGSFILTAITLICVV